MLVRRFLPFARTLGYLGAAGVSALLCVRQQTLASSSSGSSDSSDSINSSCSAAGSVAGSVAGSAWLTPTGDAPVGAPLTCGRMSWQRAVVEYRSGVEAKGAAVMCAWFSALKRGNLRADIGLLFMTRAEATYLGLDQLFVLAFVRLDEQGEFISHVSLKPDLAEWVIRSALAKRTKP